MFLTRGLREEVLALTYRLHRRFLRSSAATAAGTLPYVPRVSIILLRQIRRRLPEKSARTSTQRGRGSLISPRTKCGFGAGWRPLPALAYRRAALDEAAPSNDGA